MTDDLKPCPFCGGKASIGYFGDFEVSASCDAEFDCPGHAGACEHFGEMHVLTKDQAIKKVIESWNTRAQPPKVTALVEAARQRNAHGHLDTCSRELIGSDSMVCDCGKSALDAALAPFQEVKNER